VPKPLLALKVIDSECGDAFINERLFGDLAWRRVDGVVMLVLSGR